MNGLSSDIVQRDAFPLSSASLDQDADEPFDDLWHDGGFQLSRGLSSIQDTPPKEARKEDIKMSIKKGATSENEDKLMPFPEGTLPRRTLSLDLISLLLDRDEIEEVEAILADGALPDHAEEARIECVYSFLEQYFLPRMRSWHPLTGKELAGEAVEHRIKFSEEHPNDFDVRFQFLKSVEIALMQLKIHYGVTEQTLKDMDEVAQLVWKAVQTYQRVAEESHSALDFA